MNPLQRLRRDTLRDQILEDHANLALAANHTHVAARGRGKVIERLLVVVMTAGQDHGKGVRRQLWHEIAERGADIADEPPTGSWKALGTDEPIAIVQHPDFKSNIRGETGDRLPDMPAA